MSDVLVRTKEENGLPLKNNIFPYVVFSVMGYISEATFKPLWFIFIIK